MLNLGMLSVIVLIRDLIQDVEKRGWYFQKVTKERAREKGGLQPRLPARDLSTFQKTPNFPIYPISNPQEFGKTT